MKKCMSLMLALLLVLSLTAPAHAVTFNGEDDWGVTFTVNNEMVSNFKTSDLDDLIRGMQPGDDAIITLHLENRNSATTRWYMTNKVIDSLEDGSLTAKGGAYTYTLIYTNAAGEDTVLFDSDTVGGDTIGKGGEGLNEATNALEDFFFLDTLTSGQHGDITLRVALEGETQGNDYQDTLADLQMNFAVELVRTSARGTPTIVQTGDDTELLPYIVAALVSGVLLLLFAIFSVIRRRDQKKENQ